MIHLYLIVSLLTAQPYQFDDIGYEYYKPIVNNNLFRPLGWTVPDRSPKYELIATIVSKDYVKAYVRETRNGRDYFVGVGDAIGDNIVQKIYRGLVQLDDNGELRAQRFGLLNVGSSRKRTSSVSKGSSSTAKETITTDKGTKDTETTQRVRQRSGRGRTGGGGQWQAQIEQFQNASPEDRQRMIQEFRQMRGNRPRGRNRRGRSD